MIQEILTENLKIFQDDTLYKFTNDPIHLTKFMKVKEGDLVVDFGSGSGVIPLLLWEKIKKGKIYGLELQKSLYDLSLESLKVNNLENSIELINDKVQNAPKLFPFKFDVVVSNPPYFEMGSVIMSDNMCENIARNEVELTLLELVESARKVIKQRGKFYICYTSRRIQELCTTLSANGFGISKLKFVSAKGKAPHLVLVESYLGSKAQTQIEQMEI